MELHWALDHPYTLYTVDYSDLFRGKQAAEFSGILIPVLNPNDRLLILCLHFFKHCPFLPALLREGDFASLLLRGKLMIWLLDIYQVLVSKKEELDWELIQKKAEDWNLEEQVTACLEAVGKVYQLPVPSPWKNHRSRLKMNFLEKKVYELQLSQLRGKEKPGRAARFLFSLRSDTIFRPVRLLDLGKYIFPPLKYIRRRYRTKGVMSLWTYPGHIARAIVQMGNNLIDFLYYRLTT